MKDDPHTLPILHSIFVLKAAAPFQVRDFTKLKYSSVRSIMERAHTAGLLSRSSVDHRYRLTKEGESYVRERSRKKR